MPAELSNLEAWNHSRKVASGLATALKNRDITTLPSKEVCEQIVDEAFVDPWPFGDEAAAVAVALSEQCENHDDWVSALAKAVNSDWLCEQPSTISDASDIGVVPDPLEYYSDEQKDGEGGSASVVQEQSHESLEGGDGVEMSYGSGDLASSEVPNSENGSMGSDIDGEDTIESTQSSGDASDESSGEDSGDIESGQQSTSGDQSKRSVGDSETSDVDSSNDDSSTDNVLGTAVEDSSDEGQSEVQITDPIEWVSDHPGLRVETSEDEAAAVFTAKYKSPSHVDSPDTMREIMSEFDGIDFPSDASLVRSEVSSLASSSVVETFQGIRKWVGSLDEIGYESYRPMGFTSSSN